MVRLASVSRTGGLTNRDFKRQAKRFLRWRKRMVAASEREVELEARVLALEYLLKMCLWNIFHMRTDDEEDSSDDSVVRESKLFRRNVKTHLRKASLSGVDPALSDHMASLVHEHAVRVLDEIVQEMEAKLGRGLSARGNF